MDFSSYTYTKNAATTYAMPTHSKRELLARRDKFSVKDLSQGELEKIVTEYGFLVEDVLLLTESQAWLFSNETIITENFYIQALFKVNGFIRPQVFNGRIELLIRKYAILRTVFLRGEGLRPLQVILKSRTAEVRFHDLSNQPKAALEQALEKIMASDRRRGFDLAKDRLLRIGVFRTGLREYAVLVAQPQLVADGWDIGMVFTDLFLDEETDQCTARQLREKNFSFAKYLSKRAEQDKAPALQYWQKLLLHLRQISQVPGYKKTELPYQQAVCAAAIDRSLLAELQAMAGNNAGLIALLQTAWGIMLQHYNRSNDAVFGVILSNRSANLDNIEDSANIVNIMPVRVTCPIDMTAEELFRKQRMQLMFSQPYSYCAPGELQAICAAQSPLFNHFINFHGFSMMNRYMDVAAPFGVTPISVNSFDSRNADFGIYFRIADRGVDMEFVYHDAAFAKGQIELLQQGFLAVLRQIVQKPKVQVCEIKMPSTEQIQAAALDARTVKAEMREFLSKVPLFANLSELVIEELTNLAKMVYFVAGDVICSEGARQENFYVIYSGNVEVSRSANDGWAGTLKILKKGSVLGYEGILDQRAGSVRAEALLGDVRAVMISNKDLCIIMRKNFNLVINVMSELNEQVNKFQKLWISAKN